MLKVREKQATNAVSQTIDFNGESTTWKGFSRHFRQQIRLAGFEVVLQPDFILLTVGMNWTSADRSEANAYVWTQLSCACSKHVKAQQQFILSGDDLKGHTCWIVLSNKH